MCSFAVFSVFVTVYSLIDDFHKTDYWFVLLFRGLLRVSRRPTDRKETGLRLAIVVPLYLRPRVRWWGNGHCLSAREKPGPKILWGQYNIG